MVRSSHIDPVRSPLVDAGGFFFPGKGDDGWVAGWEVG